MGKKKSKIGIILGIIIALLLITCTILGYLLFKKEKPEVIIKPNTEKKEEKKTITPAQSKAAGMMKEDTSAYTNSLNVYTSKDDTNFCLEYNTDYCNVLIISIPVETKDAKILDVHGSNYVFYKDNNKIKVFSYKEKQSYVVSLSGTYETYFFHVNYDNNEFIGISYAEKENGKMSFYSIENGNVLYDKKYDNISQINKSFLTAADNTCTGEECTQTKAYLLDAKEEKIYLEKTPTKDDGGLYFEEIVQDNNSYLYLNVEGPGRYYKEIYTEDYNVIVKNKTNKEVGITENGNLNVLQGNVVQQYNKQGKKVKTSKKYDKILQVIDDYFVIIKDGKIAISDMKGNIKEIGEFKNNYVYHDMLSGWYKENGKYGIYLVIENSDLEYGIEGAGMEYYYIPKTGETGIIKTEGIDGYAKPVLYLYPKKDTNVTVTFDKKEQLTTTYPKYKNSWNVLAKPNGDLYINGKYYYALYWEEEPNHKVDFKEGFYVTKDNAIEFLEEKLSIIGFSDKERNEFIMYWLPILEKNKRNIVYFELTTERDSYSKINISPKPDSILRMAMHVKKVNKKISTKKQNLPAFKRDGFTAIEWGGVVY